MDPIILDDDLKAKLNGRDFPVEVRDATGRVAGQFVPQALFLKLMYAWAKTAVTAEEMEEARRSGTGDPMVVVLKRLGAA